MHYPTLFIALSLLAASAVAQEVGKLPFATIDSALQRTAGLDRSKVATRILITSKNPAVKPDAIQLTLESKAAGNVRVPIAGDGSVGDVPRTEAIRKENPFLVSNQPKGSLSLTVDVGLVVPTEKTFPYARLVTGLAELNAAIKKQGGVLAVFAGKVTKLNFVFGDPNASIILPGKSGPVTLKADASGNVSVTVDPALAKDNATVTVSAKPSWIGVAK